MSSFTASDLFALANNSKNIGDQECHWCASKCQRLWQHDDPPQPAFQKRTTTALRPGNLWVCQGCWLFRRKRVTVNFLDGGYQDSQWWGNHSWLLTPEEVLALRPMANYQTIYNKLLNPPLVFSLTLLVNGKKMSNQGPNHLHLAVVNENSKILAGTELKFVVNGAAFAYTIYELEKALRQKHSEGMEPGVRTLVDLFGVDYQFKQEAPEQEAPNIGGRPKRSTEPKDLIIP